MVTETFVSIIVADMERATAFYVTALGASITFASPRWTSLELAGVRVALFHDTEHGDLRTGLHFVVSELAVTLEDVERAGGRIVEPPAEVAPGVITADVADTERNTFALRQA